MSTSIRPQGRPLLLSLCLLLTHGVASGESAEDHWAGILASETNLWEINPSQFGGDMEEMLASAIEQAAALADRVNEHQARFPDSPHLGEAGQKRMDLLRVAAMGGGARLTELRFTAFDGSEVDLRDYRGKVVLLDFWATWCAPCLVDAPVIRSVWDSLHDRGFEVIGISYDTDRAALERYLGRTGQSWPQFFSDEGNKAPLIQEFGNPPPPTYWLIDQRGVLVDINGFVNLEEKVRRLIAEAEG